MSRLLCEIPDHDHRELKVCCARLGMSLKDFVYTAVMEKVHQSKQDLDVGELKNKVKGKRDVSKKSL